MATGPQNREPNPPTAGASFGTPADAHAPAGARAALGAGDYSAANTALAAWYPLRETLFRRLWIAAVVSYTGTWMQNVGAGWLMAQTTMSPLMVGLVQAANTLPVFLLVLPAGALADVVDRRRLLIATQTWMVVASAALGVLTIAGFTTPWLLLFFTALLGIGAVVNDPAWQAITPEIVSPPNLASAIALNSAGFNVARAVGPALGGLVVAAGSTWLGSVVPRGVLRVEAGAGLSFLVNAASFLGVIVFLLCWRRRPHDQPEAATRVWHSMKTGLQYVRHAAGVKSVLVRTGAFSVAAAALWAMLPLIAHDHGVVAYGILLGCLGAGAVVGAALLPAIRRCAGMDALVVWATLLYAAVTFAAGELRSFGWLCVALFAGGLGWIAILASLNFCAQTMSPPWLRARSLAVYLFVLQGGLSAGSALWGAVADRIGISHALLAAALTLVFGLAVAPRHRLALTHVQAGGAVQR